MSAHTPGPWHHDKSAGYVFVTTDGGKQDMDVARVFKDADGRLIAAAPDLLEALRGLLDNLNGYEHHPDLCSRTMECDEPDEDGCSYCGSDECPACECGLVQTQGAMSAARAAIAKAEGCEP